MTCRRWYLPARRLFLAAWLVSSVSARGAGAGQGSASSAKVHSGRDYLADFVKKAKGIAAELGMEYQDIADECYGTTSGPKANLPAMSLEEESSYFHARCKAIRATVKEIGKLAPVPIDAHASFALLKRCGSEALDVADGFEKGTLGRWNADSLGFGLAHLKTERLFLHRLKSSLDSLAKAR